MEAISKRQPAVFDLGREVAAVGPCAGRAKHLRFAAGATGKCYTAGLTLRRASYSDAAL